MLGLRRAALLVLLAVATHFLLAVATPVGVHAEPSPGYSIDEDEPRLGSHVRKQAVGPTKIAVNLPYHELPPEDRARLHDQYERMAEGDEPPFPLNGLRSILDPIRQGQVKLQVTGKLHLIATIGPDGKVREVKALSSPSPEMTRFAAQIMAVTRYKPALCGGQACTMDLPLRVNFQVE